MKTIVVPLDGSSFGEHALPAALAIARRGLAHLNLVHVHQMQANTLSPTGTPFFDPEVDETIRIQERAYLEDVTRQIGAVWDGPVSHALLTLPVAEAICTHAHDIDAQLIVLSTHGRGGIARAWLGSVADRVIRHAKIPTLTIHPQSEPPQFDQGPTFEHILVPLDGSALAEQALDMVVQVCGDTPAHYDLVRVVEPVSYGFALSAPEPLFDADAQEEMWHVATEYLDRVAAPLRARGHVVMTYVPIGHPASAILERAEMDEVTLIAMTTHGRSGMSRALMGSVADKVLRGTTTPVLISRPPE
ncbi:MAG: universal stress protein [Oscillochloris sp.]|nr:universal stress protein [Oscillochloris sp.]